MGTESEYGRFGRDRFSRKISRKCSRSACRIRQLRSGIKMSEVMQFSRPEQYHLKQTLNVPNSVLPALVYRNILPRPHSAASAQTLCESNGWERRVCVEKTSSVSATNSLKGEWGVIKLAHFHPNTHECYGEASSSKTNMKLTTRISHIPRFFSSDYRALIRRCRPRWS